MACNDLKHNLLSVWSEVLKLNQLVYSCSKAVFTGPLRTRSFVLFVLLTNNASCVVHASNTVLKP